MYVCVAFNVGGDKTLIKMNCQELNINQKVNVNASFGGNLFGLAIKCNEHRLNEMSAKEWALNFKDARFAAVRFPDLRTIGYVRTSKRMRKTERYSGVKYMMN